MTSEQAIIFGVLAATLVLFILGRWRYDIVALLALLAVALTGVSPVDEVFSGFSHPAVITVAAVLILSKALQNSGIVDFAAGWMFRVGDNLTVQLLAMVGLVAVASMFMNNVGAIALLMPVAIHIARRKEISPSIFLMPLAFGSLLGGMVTLIGTPPNIIIASFRTESGSPPFQMFDYSPVGLGIAIAGIAFVSIIGWRLIPRRRGQVAQEELFQIGGYITEVRVQEGSDMVGKTIREVESLADTEVMIVALERAGRRLPAPPPFEIVQTEDVLLAEGDPQDLETFVGATGLELVGREDIGSGELGSDDVVLMEAVVTPNSPMIGRSSLTLNLRWRYSVNLLAVSREGAAIAGRLANVRFRAGDVLLFQGRSESLQEAMNALRCLPLAERGLRLGQPRRLFLSVSLFTAAIIATALGLVPIHVSFVSAAVIMVLVRIISLREAYESVDWSIIILIGAMIPVGLALESTGGAELLANRLLDVSGGFPPVVTLIIILVGTMFLSDLVNNAAAAVLMAPIAIVMAESVGASPDPFLMSVAIGASSAFLTPIGHQSNTLVMGPGGYKFSDYWRMGLPLEILIVIVSIPLLTMFWPL